MNIIQELEFKKFCLERKIYELEEERKDLLNLADKIKYENYPRAQSYRTQATHLLKRIKLLREDQRQRGLL